MTRAQIVELADQTSDAFSFDRYASWTGCVQMLARRGYDRREIEAILRSKWMRWAHDNSNKPYGRSTSVDLARFLDANKHRGCGQGDVNELVAGTFNE